MFAPSGATPIMPGAVRMTLGGISLLTLAWMAGSFKTSQSWPKNHVVLLATALAGFNLFFFTALATTGVAVGTVVAIGSAPVFAGLLGWAIRKERPSGGWAAATCMAVIGCALLFLSQEDIVVDSLGIVYALCAGFSYSSYTEFSKKLLEKHHPMQSYHWFFCSVRQSWLCFLWARVTLGFFQREEWLSVFI